MFPILLAHILIGGLLVFSSCVLIICSKQSWMYDTEYDPSGNSNLSVYVGTDVLEFIVVIWASYIFPCIVNATYLKQHIYLSSLGFFLSEWLRNEDQLFFLFSEFINIGPILFDNFIEFIISLYTFLVICFARYKEYIVWSISLSKFLLAQVLLTVFKVFV